MRSLKEECEAAKTRARSRSRSRSRDRSHSRSRSSSRSRSRYNRSRRRSRSRSRGRSDERHLANDTNSRDPKLLNSRVFIGNLPTSKLNREELEDIFKKYGNLLGVSLLKGFGFVQFEDEGDARRACHMENGGLLKGLKIDVKMAAEGRRDSRGSAGRGGSTGRRSPPFRDRSPGGRDFGRGSAYPMRDRSPPRRDFGGRGSLRDRSPPGREFDRPPGRDLYDDPYRRSLLLSREEELLRRAPLARDPLLDPFRRGHSPLGSDLAGRPGASLGRDPYLDPYRDVLPPPAIAPPTASLRPPYDCEIILTSRKINTYAELIERRLRQAGMLTRILDIPGEGHLPRVMDEINSRKLPYCIILNDQNEAHGSMTLNVLHGTPQEHRNMPLEDALNFITRNFETYSQEQQAKHGGRTPAAAAPTPDATPAREPGFSPPDPNTIYLLNLMADKRFLSLEELDTVLKYVTERRDKLAIEQGRPARNSTVENKGELRDERAIAQQQQELQNKILNILNGSEGSGDRASTQKIATAVPGFAGNTTANNTAPAPNLNVQNLATSINFDNPSVQQALDNLIGSSSLLKNIGSDSTTVTTATQPPPPPPSQPPQVQPQQQQQYLQYAQHAAQHPVQHPAQMAYQHQYPQQQPTEGATAFPTQGYPAPRAPYAPQY